MHCDNCGHQVSTDSRFCVACGKELPAGVYPGSSQATGYQQALAPRTSSSLAPAAVPQPPAPFYPPPPPQAPYSPQAQLGRRDFARTYAEGKSPGLALFLSFLLTGVGQFYNGDIKKGLLMLGGAVLGIFVTAGVGTFIIWIWSMIDAQRVASRTIPLWT